MAMRAGPAGAGAASMAPNSVRMVAARSWALTSRSPRQATAVSASLWAKRQECSAGSTRTRVVGPHCTVSPPVTTSSCSSGTPLARRQWADSGEATTVAPVRSAMASAP